MARVSRRGSSNWYNSACRCQRKDPGLPPAEGSRAVEGELSKADGWAVDSDLPAECSPRKLTKRSSPSEVSWLRGRLGSREANCQIFSLTTAALPRATPSRVSTQEPGKATTQRSKATSPKGEPPRLLYFMPFQPSRKHAAVYNIFLPVSGHNVLRNYKPPGGDSSEERKTSDKIDAEILVLLPHRQCPASSAQAGLCQTVLRSQRFPSWKEGRNRFFRAPLPHLPPQDGCSEPKIPASEAWKGQPDKILLALSKAVRVAGRTAPFQQWRQAGGRTSLAGQQRKLLTQCPQPQADDFHPVTHKDEEHRGEPGHGISAASPSVSEASETKSRITTTQKCRHRASLQTFSCRGGCCWADNSALQQSCGSTKEGLLSSLCKG
ncbi:uncharacterized protein LOC132577959 [Heteronotia binoei]|uniref:uncharacterized protein LOC132577959 n=1 Tax=Heteronotia binoei TaxID=13085 RepID=UPI00292CC288|nr:uncharacterized protein LOC132577959 [Heteronotia binoei]